MEADRGELIPLRIRRVDSRHATGSRQKSVQVDTVPRHAEPGNFRTRFDSRADNTFNWINGNQGPSALRIGHTCPKQFAGSVINQVGRRDT